MGFDPLVAENWRDKRWHLGAAGVGPLSVLLYSMAPMNIATGWLPPAAVWHPWVSSQKYFSKHHGWDNHKRYRTTFYSLIAHNTTLHSVRDTRSIKISKAGHWEDLENRRQFLVAFAKQMNFDPMIKANWNRPGLRNGLFANEVWMSSYRVWILMFPFLFREWVSWLDMAIHFKRLWLMHFLNYSHQNQQVSLFSSLAVFLL